MTVANGNLKEQWHVSPPKVVWKINAGDGYSGCAIVDNTFIHFERVDETDSLIRGDLKTGKAIWKQDFKTQYVDSGGFGNGPRCTPIVDGNRIYTFAPNGMLRCHQLKNGEVIWQVDTVADFNPSQPMYGVGSTPLVHQDDLLVIIGDRETGGNSQALVSFDKFTGEVKARFGKGFASYASPKVVETKHGPICFAFLRHGLLAVNLRTGKESGFDWAARISGCVNAATPVVHDQQVLITEAYQLGCVSLDYSESDSTAVVLTPRWQSSKRSRDKILASHWNTPVFFGDHVYGCDGRHSSRSTMRCVDWKTGEVKWKIRLDERGSYISIGDKILVVGESGYFRLVDADPTQFVGQNSINFGIQRDGDNPFGAPTLTYPIWAPPAFSNGLLLVRGKQELVCIDLNQ